MSKISTRKFTTRFVAFTVVVLCSVFSILMPALSAQTPVLVLEGRTLIGATGTPLLRDAIVVIENKKITAVGKKERISYPIGARIISVAGKFMLLGLIDMHVY